MSRLVGGSQGRFQPLMDTIAAGDLPWRVEWIPVAAASPPDFPDPQIDLALVASSAKGFSARDWVFHFRRHHPKVPVLIYGPARELDSLFLLLNAGAVGWMIENPSCNEFAQAVEEASSGDCPLPKQARQQIIKQLHAQFLFHLDAACLSSQQQASVFPRTKSQERGTKQVHLSRQQQAIVMCLLEGKTPKEIPDELHVKYSTFHTHLARLMKRLDVHHWSQIVSKHLSGGALLATKRDTE